MRYLRRTRVSLRVVAPPAIEPIELADAYQHLRIDNYENLPDDDLIRGLISASREWCEDYLARSIAPQTLELSLARFPDSYIAEPFYSRYGVVGEDDDLPGGIELPMGPVLGIVSVAYIDDQGATQQVDLDGWQLDTGIEPAMLYPGFGLTWPTPRRVASAVRIRYIAGYTVPGDSPQDPALPASIIAAMKLVLGHLYENRSNTTAATLTDLPLSAKHLLDRYRLRTGIA